LPLIDAKSLDRRGALRGLPLPGLKRAALLGADAEQGSRIPLHALIGLPF
jgi:hypothetical protein